jgi:L-ascorbate metabolism protein UlaG (beta-lactamase superfamily)
MSNLVEQIQALPLIPNSLALWALGQSGFIIKGPEAVVYLDPYLSDSVGQITGGRVTRAFPPPIQPDAITNADYILCTHEHLDHFDPQTVLPALSASPQAKLVVPGWCLEPALKEAIARERIIVARDTLTLPGTSLRLTCVPSAHYAKEYDAEKGYRWLGYVIEWNGVTLYHSGDTIIYDGYIDILRALPPIDIALLPINGRDWFREQTDVIGNLNPAEAMQLTALMGWDMLIPLHNDLFPTNRVSWTQFASALESFAPNQRFKRIQPGEMYYYVKV